MDYSTVESFGRIEPGATIALLDKRSISNQLAAGLGDKPITRTVKQAERIIIGEEQGEILIFDITHEKEACRKILLAKIVDGFMDVRVYDEDPAFPKGLDREGILGVNELWVSNTEHIFFNMKVQVASRNALTYCQAFSNGDLNFVLKGGELEGQFYMVPEEEGVDYPLLATVCDYGLEEGKQVGPEVPDQALILEIGSEESDNGGIISLYYGYAVGNEEYLITFC